MASKASGITDQMGQGVGAAVDWCSSSWPKFLLIAIIYTIGAIVGAHYGYQNFRFDSMGSDFYTSLMYYGFLYLGGRLVLHSLETNLNRDLMKSEENKGGIRHAAYWALKNVSAVVCRYKTRILISLFFIVLGLAAQVHGTQSPMLQFGKTAMSMGYVYCITHGMLGASDEDANKRSAEGEMHDLEMVRNGVYTSDGTYLTLAEKRRQDAEAAAAAAEQARLAALQGRGALPPPLTA